MRRRRLLAAIGILSLACTISISVLHHGYAEDNATSPSAITCLDLQPKANQKLKDSLHGFSGNNLAELPSGEQVFNSIRFKVEDGYIRLGSRAEREKPEKVQGIEVGMPVSKLYFLHGTGYGSYGAPGGPIYVEDGTPIGEYTVHYEDGSTTSIPIVYGADVRDWWSWGKSVEVSRGKIAWEGMNDASREEKQLIRLYLTTWENPKPDKKVVSLDYVSTFKSAAAPFCVAITAESK
ncbi:hypothetical protein ACXR0O_12405 [Verrucomicrobiota bacterium sgz303538]